MILATLLTSVVMAASGPVPRASAAGNEDWLTAVNHFRAQAGVPPVGQDAALNPPAVSHSCYMVRNGISHSEEPGQPGYTPEGSASGQRSNVAVSSSATATDRSFVELWMAAPYHAIGVLRPGTTSMSYGSCRDATSAPWRSGATLDVVAGMGEPTREPVVWPGNGARTDLNRFIAESPSPITECGWSGAAGLPLVALLPEAPAQASAQLIGPDGPVATCVLTAANSTHPTAKAILQGDNAVVIVPRDELAPGAHSVTLTTSARRLDWTFTIDPAAADWTIAQSPVGAPVEAPVGSDPIAITAADAGFSPLPPQRLVDSRTGLGTGRLRANVGAPVQIGGVGPVPAGATAVSINLTAVAPAGDGYISAYPCDASPTVSIVNFRAGADTPNAALVPLDPGGRLCLFSSVDTEVLVDVNGALLGTAAGRLVTTAPDRLVDSRQALRAPGRLAAGDHLAITIAGSGSPIPAEATAAVLNVTAVDPGNDGFVSVYPCGGGVPVVSSLNPHQGETRPNLVIVPIGPGGRICVYTTAALDLIVDVTGWVESAGQRFSALTPTRLADTRNTVRVPAGGTLRVPVAGVRGLPTDTSAIAANITAVGPTAGGYVTAYGCNTTPPPTSTLNLNPGQDTANGAQVQLGTDGALCLFSTVTTDLIVDINGIWS